MPPLCRAARYPVANIHFRFGNNNDNNGELRDYEGLCLIPFPGHTSVTNRQRRVCQVLTSVNSGAFFKKEPLVFQLIQEVLSPI